MNNVPDEYLENYAADMLKKKEYVDNLVDRSIDRKLTVALKDVVKLNEKEISLDDFNKLFEAK
jgi:trigger factor